MQVRLRILATTDLHAHIYPYDYYADRWARTLGLSQVAALIDTLRAEEQNCLLFDNGDFLQGNPLGDHVAAAQDRDADRLHPMTAAMNALRYDAATLGNHEFNYGVGFLLRSLRGARFPVVSANARTARAANPDPDATLLAPYALLDRSLQAQDGRRATIRIGVIGFLPPQTMVWDRAHLAGRITTPDIVEAAERCVPRMKAAGADLIVALCHSGIGAFPGQPGMENAAVALATVPGIDALVAGHSHLVFPSPDFAGLPGVDVAEGTLCGKPSVMSGSFGSHLGVIDMTLRHVRGDWQVIAASAKVRPAPRRGKVAFTPSERAVRAAARDDHRATLTEIRRPVGQTRIAINSFFAMLPGNRALALVAEAQRWHLAEVLRGTAHAALPLLSATAPFKMGGRGGPDYYTDIPPGPLALRNVADLYLYPNTLCAAVVTGADLKDWLERAAGVFAQCTAGMPPAALLDPGMPSSQFDVIHGASWTIDLSAPARFDPQGRLADAGAHRIAELRHAGRRVQPGDRFVIATNSYRAAGGTGFPGLPPAALIHETREPNRDILRRYIAATGTINSVPLADWRFRALPGHLATIDTSPRAADHLDTIAALRPVPSGRTDAGFLRITVTL